MTPPSSPWAVGSCGTTDISNGRSAGTPSCPGQSTRTEIPCTTCSSARRRISSIPPRQLFDIADSCCTLRVGLTEYSSRRMAMALFGADTVRITVRGIAEEQAIVNVLHYMPPGPELGEIDAELSSLLSAFATAWKDKILPLLCSTYSVVDYHAVAVKGSEVFAAQNRPPHKGLTLGDEFTRTAGFGDEGVVGTAPLPTF